MTEPNKAHIAAYGMLNAQAARLKASHPDAYMAALGALTLEQQWVLDCFRALPDLIIEGRIISNPDGVKRWSLSFQPALDGMLVPTMRGWSAFQFTAWLFEDVRRNDLLLHGESDLELDFTVSSPFGDDAFAGLGLRVQAPEDARPLALQGAWLVRMWNGAALRDPVRYPPVTFPTRPAVVVTDRGPDD